MFSQTAKLVVCVGLLTCGIIGCGDSEQPPAENKATSNQTSNTEVVDSGDENGPAIEKPLEEPPVMDEGGDEQ